MSPSRHYDRGDRSELFEKFANCLRVLARASRRRVVLFLDEFSEVTHGIQKKQVVLLKEREFSRLYTL